MKLDLREMKYLKKSLERDEAFLVVNANDDELEWPVRAQYKADLKVNRNIQNKLDDELFYEQELEIK